MDYMDVMDRRAVLRDKGEIIDRMYCKTFWISILGVLLALGRIDGESLYGSC